MASAERQEIIRAVYNDPETGFGSLRDTYLQANEKDPGIRYIDVQHVLAKYDRRQAQTTFKGSNSWVSPGLLFRN